MNKRRRIVNEGQFNFKYNQKALVRVHISAK